MAQDVAGESSRRDRPRRLGRGLSSLLSTPVAIEVPVATVAADRHASVVEKSDNNILESISAAAPVVGPRRAGDAGQIETGARAGDVAMVPALSDAAAGGAGLVMVEVSQIGPSPFQPRRVIDDAALAQLEQSIRRSGVMQPVVVRRAGAAGDGGGGVRFELVAGERRWRAATRAGLARIPAVLRDLSDEEAAEWALVENVQREDLNAIERAEAFARLSSRFGLSHAQIAERVGLERSSVANTVRLLELESSIRDLISSGRLDQGHGKALLGVGPGPAREALARQAADEHWSVRRLERAAAAASGGRATPSSRGSANDFGRLAARAALEKQLGEHLGTRVSITTTRGGTKGRLMLEFYDLDHFDGLLHRIGFSPRS